MLRPVPRRVAALLVCAILLAGCSGGSDNRPPTIVSGNVRSVSTTTATGALGKLWRFVRSWWSPEAVAQVPGITVAIENTDNATSTDEQGLFRLEGDQLGPAVIQFAGTGVVARLAITLPAGGEIDLINVDIENNEVTVGEQRIQFEGPITGVDCEGSLLQVLSGSRVPYRVRLVSGTTIVDQDGAPLRCVDLVGGTAEVAGTVEDDGDVTALSIRVNPAAPTSTATTVEGAVTSLRCPTDLTVASDDGNVRVNLGTSTVVRDTDGSPITCADLDSGDLLRCRGTLRTFGLDAAEIDRLAPAPTPTPTGTPTPTP